MLIETLLSKTANDRRRLSVNLLAVLGSIIWGLSNTLWANSIGAEVYSMGMALAIGIILAFIRHIDHPKPGLMVFTFYIFGLAMTNHLSVVALAPMMLAMLFRPRFKLRYFIWASLLFIMAITLYLYLPLRSLNYPLVDWSHPAGWQAFVEHISSVRFRGFFAQFSLINFALNLKRFFSILPREFPMTFIGLFGIIYLAWKKPKYGVALLIAMIINIIYASMYEIPDIEPHFLITTFIAVVGLVIILSVIFEILSKHFKNIWPFVYGGPLLLSIILIMEIRNNYAINDESDNRLAESYGNLILKSLPRNSFFVSVGWSAGAPGIYLRYVENVASDLTLFDPISMASGLAKFINKQDSLKFISEQRLAFRAFDKWPSDKFLGKDHLWGGDNPFKYGQLPLQGYGLVYRYGEKAPADLSVWQNMDLPKSSPNDTRLGLNERALLANIYLSWGEDLQSVGMIQEAREKYQIACDFSENSADPLIPNAMGIFFRRQGIVDLAQREYLQALASSFISNKVRADILVNMGNLFRDKRDYELARSRYLDALKFRPGHPEAEYNLAVTEAYISLNNKNYKQAIDDFLAAIRLDPSDPLLFYNIGLIYDNYLGNAGNAITYYNEFLRRSNEGGAMAANLRARIAFLAGDRSQ